MTEMQRSRSQARRSPTKRRAKSKPAPKKKPLPDFDLSTTNVKLPEYNSLTDSHLRHYFSNPKLRRMLREKGLIDKAGRIVDYEKNKAKLFIIEQEFKAAEKLEFWRKKEEEEMRRRIQLKRHEAVEQSRKAEWMSKLKEERERRNDFIRRTLYDQISYISPPKQRPKTKGGSRAPSRAGTSSSPGRSARPQSSAGGSALATEGEFTKGTMREFEDEEDDFYEFQGIDDELARLTKELHGSEQRQNQEEAEEVSSGDEK